MIQCQQCKMMNPPADSLCKQCGADLLPGLSRSNRIKAIILGVFIALLLGVPAFLTMLYASTKGGMTDDVNCIILFLFLVAALLFLGALYLALRKTPVGQRYFMRAHRHLEVDLNQALSDYTEAVKIVPGNIQWWKDRNALYEKLELKRPEFDREIQFLSTALESNRVLLLSKVREELSKQIVLLYTKLIDLLELVGELGNPREKWDYKIKQLKFMETHVEDLLMFQTDSIGWGTGVTLANREFFCEQILQQHISLYQSGIIRAVAYCHSCMKLIEPIPIPRSILLSSFELCCPNDNNHKRSNKNISDIKFARHEEFDNLLKEMQQKYRI